MQDLSFRYPSRRSRAGMFLAATHMPTRLRSRVGMPSLKESWLSRGVFRIFSDGFSFIAHVASTSKPVGFVC